MKPRRYSRLNLFSGGMQFLCGLALLVTPPVFAAPPVVLPEAPVALPQAAAESTAAAKPAATDSPAPAAQVPSGRFVEELLSGLARQSKPDWAGKFRPLHTTPLVGRVQTALVLGIFLADSYLSAQAEDSQQCRNAGKEMLALAKTLGVQNEVLDRGRSLGEAAQRRDWPAVRLELEAIFAELSAVLRAHQDEGIVRLIALGSWLRGLEIVAGTVSEGYSEPAALLLRQPALALEVEASFERLSPALSATPLLVQLRPQLREIQLLLSGPQGEAPTQTEVKSLATLLTKALNGITSAPQP
jgi:hypothetical protein